jgi:hypothetical protein
MDSSLLDKLGFGAGAAVILVISIAAFLIPAALIYPPVPPSQSDALQQTHSRAGVRRSESNLRDQRSARHLPRDGTPARVQSLLIYPVKSCRGIEVTKNRVLPAGLD